MTAYFRRLARTWLTRRHLASIHPVLGTALGLGSIAVLIPSLLYLHGANGQLRPSIPLLFLVPVLLASALGGRITGIAVALAAVAAWNWFFIPPQHTFTVNYTRDLLALLVFLAVGLLTGQLAARAHRQAQDAIRRAASAEALYDLSSALIGQQDLLAVLSALTQRLYDSFHLTACAIVLNDDGTGAWHTAAVAGNLPAAGRVENNRTLQGMVTWVNAHGERSKLAGKQVEFVPLHARDRSVGVLQLVRADGTTPDEEQGRLLHTFVNGAAIAIEQARLAQEERVASMVRESDRLKTALLSSVSHDLRTPLAGIKAAATSLLQDDIQWSDEDRRVFALDIDAEADRLTRLVTNLLDLSRIEAGGLRPDKDWEDISELIARVVERLTARPFAHTITVDVSPELPPVYLDSIQIEQALTNLVENAAKYSPNGSPIEVHAGIVAGPREVNELQISVSDQGRGIGVADRERIFDKFYRVQAFSRGTSGTGMGLAIVRGFVAAHGGRVWADSAMGQGSTFTIALPLTASPATCEDTAALPALEDVPV